MQTIPLTHLSRAGQFFESESGNEALDVPGFDLDGVDDQDIASGTVVIAGVSKTPQQP